MANDKATWRPAGTSPAFFPHGQAGWHAFAAALNARMARLQVHVEPDWLFAVCTHCGWDFEAGRPEISRFRFEVASHECETFAAVPAAVPVLDELLF
jgi:hypothetical protein